MKRNQKEAFPSWVAYEPELVPPLHLMRSEGIDVIEEWFRWAEEWSMLLRIFGKITPFSDVLEIGCGLGRIAFPLRYILSSEGSYSGFEITKEKVDFLREYFHRAHKNFHFTWADIHNTYYNSKGTITASDYRFPYPEQSFDLVYAASVFTHMLPVTVEHYLKETSRVLRPGGRAVFSFFILDNYVKGQQRAKGFVRAGFNFDHSFESYGDEFAISVPENPEEMTAYKLSMIKRFAERARLEFEGEPLPGVWSGSSSNWVGAQDIVILRKPA